MNNNLIKNMCCRSDHVLFESKQVDLSTIYPTRSIKMILSDYNERTTTGGINIGFIA